MPMKVLNFAVTDDIREMVADEAKEMEVSEAWVIRRALKLYFESKEKQPAREPEKARTK